MTTRRPLLVRFFLRVLCDPRRPVVPKLVPEGAETMNPISDPSNLMTPARRRALPAATVLIRIPAVASSRPLTSTGRIPARRRRLRREVRVAGYLLLGTMPILMLLTIFRDARRTGSTTSSRLASVEASASEMPRILLSIAPEPILSTQIRGEVDSTIGLSPKLLPAADASEESSDGGN